jgi:hypothetical protein
VATVLIAQDQKIRRPREILSPATRMTEIGLSRRRFGAGRQSSAPIRPVHHRSPRPAKDGTLE